MASGTSPAAQARPLTAQRLLGVALVAATAMGCFSTIVLKFAIAGAGGNLSWAEAALGWIDWYLWAALTPLVVWLARVLPVSGRNWLAVVAGHAAIGSVLALLELALFAWIMTGYAGLLIDRDLAPYRERYVTLVGRWLPVELLIYALIVSVVTAVEHGRWARERDVTAARLEADLARAQVGALQAQIHPHFLFNALNTIAMSVREGRSREAVSMMADLGGILRRSLDAAVRPETSLRRELEFVRDYLRIEKYRLEERLQVRWSIDTGVLMARVPTMILQPLVENAVKHGIAEQPEGGEVTIRARRAAQDLELSVDDSGTGIDPGAEPGIGIRNVRRRLATQYGTKAGLEVTRRAAGGTVARLTIPLRFDGNTGDTQDDSMPAR
jgi:hypothetical protein